MATTLRAGHDQVIVDQTLGSLLDACNRLHATSGFIAFAKTVFGEVCVNAGVKERKEELRQMGANGGHMEQHVCRQLMRTYVTLLDNLDEQENAAELLKLAKSVYETDTCEQEIANVRSGM